MKATTRNILLHILQEIVWWVIGIVIAAAVMYPLYTKMQYNYIFLNGLLVVLAVIYFRYTLFFKKILWLQSLWFRFLLFVVNINFFIYLLRKEQLFMSIYDTFMIEDLGKPFKVLTLSETEWIYLYFFKEVNIAVTACLVFILIFNFRLIASYWKIAKGRLEDVVEN